MSGKKKEKFVDDGRTIANMNVEGMPWYNPAKNNHSTDAIQQTDSVSEKNAGTQQDELTTSGKFAMLTGILGAAMLIALLFIGVFLLFILFCSKVWLH